MFFSTVKVKDVPMVDIQDTDIVIPVMGPTGVGKSSFINRYLAAVRLPETARVGESLSSCTDSLGVFTIENPGGSRVILVDTPGFEDSLASDSTIFKRISHWRLKSYGRKNTEFGGVVYLHDIAQDRVAGAASRTPEYLHLLKRDCGAPSNKVVLVTSKWTYDPDSKKLEGREEELKRSCWNKIVGPEGASVMRLRPGEEKDSAVEVIESIVKRVKEERARRAGQKGEGSDMFSKLRKAASNLFSCAGAIVHRSQHEIGPTSPIAAAWICAADVRCGGDLDLNEGLGKKLKKVEKRLNKRVRQLLVHV